MLGKLFRRLVGDPNERELSRLRPIVEQINALEPEMQDKSQDELQQMTRAFRQRLISASQGAKDQLESLRRELETETDDDERRAMRRQIESLEKEIDRDELDILDEILPEAFAAVRQVSMRTTGMRHFDEQLLGGIVLHQARIAEMKTGEGKTLVATLPLYLNALAGRGAHLVTPNDYLSKVGVQWMGAIYHYLGLSVGVIQSMGQDPTMSSFLFDPDYVSADDRYQHLAPCSRREAYEADITYGTNNEFGFDYLRDNMVTDASQRVVRELYYAIIDEIDNILIDEARTPLIISGQAEESSSEYRQFAEIISHLRPEIDYIVDEKQRSATITEEGIAQVEQRLGIDNLYAPEHFELTPYLENALKALALFRRDRDYIVQNREVIIVDEFTGRLMYGRRYSEGLHQAIEAKERVPIRRESLTLATITFQNLFRMYRRLAGMTGTAVTEAEEFDQIYALDVMVIPTHRPLVRDDRADVVYKTKEAKFSAVLDEIRDCHERGQPVLVGTLSVETSEMLSKRLGRRIPHRVLNAKQHESEAQTIAQAGQPGAVTIATNMAGRGVDILLGGNPEGLAREEIRRQGHDLNALDPELWKETLEKYEKICEENRALVLASGGLHVIGTERHEARRIDNQLRGRAGRQGDPGSSRFFVALEDDLMRLFGGPSVANIMERLGVEEDMPIEHGMVSKAIASAQIRVEGHNFDLRKHILEYDDVVNQQRKVIYEQRRLIMSEANLRPIVQDLLQQELVTIIETHTADEEEEEWDLRGLHAVINRMIHLPVAHTVATWANMTRQEIIDQTLTLADRAYDTHEELVGAELMRQVERLVMLRAIDNRWIHHLTALDELREGIGLRAVAQRNPLVEYKREAFAAFEQLLADIQSDIARFILNTRVGTRQSRPRRARPLAVGSSSKGKPQQARRKLKTGRNAPCPCGSGKKYKNCCQPKGLSPEEAAAQTVKVR